MKLNKIFTLLTFVCCINFINCMKLGQIIKVDGQEILLDGEFKEVISLINNRKLSPFFEWLEKQDYDWLWENQKIIKAIIEADRLYMLGINTIIEDRIMLSEAQEQWCQKYKLMNDGIDCVLQDLNNEKVQKQFNSMKDRIRKD